MLAPEVGGVTDRDVSQAYRAQVEMAEFLSLVAIGSVGVSADGRAMLMRDGVPVRAADLDAQARAAQTRGYTVEASRRLGLTNSGRAALRQLRATTTGVVPHDEQFHRMVAEHARWIDAMVDPGDRTRRAPRVVPPPPMPDLRQPPAPAAEPAPVPFQGPPPPGWVEARRSPSLLYTPTAPGPSWLVELAGVSPEALRRSLSAEQAAELTRVLDEVRAALR